MTFKPHILCLEKKLSRSIGILCKLKNYMSSSILLKLYHTLIHTHMQFFPVTKIHSRNTRSNFRQNLSIPRYKTNRLQQLKRYKGAKIWNSVPHNQRNLSFKSFCKNYKTYLLDKL